MSALLRMLLTVIAAVVAVRLLMNVFRSRKEETNVQGRPRGSAPARKHGDVEDAEFKEIKE